MSSFDKYRVHEVAKDFGLPSKNITEILTKYATTPKNHMQVLEDSELSVIFEYLTQQHQCATMEDLVRVPAVEKKPEPKKEQPAPQAKPAQEPARAQSAAPAEGFEAEFAANPIDQRLEEDLMMASSSSLVLQAYDTAAGFWQDVIDTAYAQAGEALSTDEYAVVQQEQGDWEAALEPAVQEIRSQHGEDEMAAASAVVDFYKERAKSLCQSIYNATGALPQFPNTSGEAQG